MHVKRPRHNSEWRLLASTKRRRVLGGRSLQFQKNILTPCSGVNPVSESSSSFWTLKITNHGNGTTSYKTEVMAPQRKHCISLWNKFHLFIIKLLPELIKNGLLYILLLLLSSSSSSSSPLCRVFILIFLRQTMSLGNTVLQYSVVTIHGAYIVSFSVESIVFYISTF